MPDPLRSQSPWLPPSTTGWPTTVPLAPLPSAQNRIPTAPMRPMLPPMLSQRQQQPMATAGFGSVPPAPLPPRTGPGGLPPPVGGQRRPMTYEQYTSQQPDLSQFFGMQAGLNTDAEGNPIPEYGLNQEDWMMRSDLLGQAHQQSQDYLDQLREQRLNRGMELDNAIKEGNLGDMVRLRRQVREIENLHAMGTFQSNMMGFVSSALSHPGVMLPAIMAMGGPKALMSMFQAPQLGMEGFQQPGIPHVLGDNEESFGMRELMGQGGPLANNPEAVRRSMTPGSYGTGEGGLPALGQGGGPNYDLLQELMSRAAPLAGLAAPPPNTNYIPGGRPR